MDNRKKYINEKKRKRIAAIVAFLLLSALASPANADMAPPLQPPGANPGVQEFVQTDVVMVYEEVDIVVGGISNLYYSDNMPDAVNAHVTARFQMVNRGEKNESLQPMFPLTNTQASGDGYMNNPELQNLSIKVKDNPVVWDVITTPNPFNGEGQPVKWAQFDVTFPAKASIWIEVTYDLQSTGITPEATFYYLLETGGGWSESIEEGHITLTLPYEASEENILFGTHYMEPFENKTTAGARFDGNEAIWDFYFLEPRTVNNWTATLINPDIWQEVLDLRKQIKEGDTSAYAELTLVYDGIIIGRSIRTGTEALIDINYNTYKKAIEIEPENDDVLARFADFKLFLFERDHASSYGPASIHDVYQTAQDALEINPGNAIALSVIKWVEGSYEESEYSTADAPKGEMQSQLQTPVAEEPGERNQKIQDADRGFDFSDLLLPAVVLLVGLICGYTIAKLLRQRRK